MNAPNRQLQFIPGAPKFLKSPAHHFKIIRIGEPEPSYKLDSAELSMGYWEAVISAQDWFDDNKEQLVVLLLSTRYAIQGYHLVSMGTVNESIAHPREIFRIAVATGSYAIIVMHNHPSSDPSPSQSDHSLTRRLSEGAELLQIKMLDHVIAGKPTEGRQRYFSFKEAGVL